MKQIKATNSLKTSESIFFVLMIMVSFAILIVALNSNASGSQKAQNGVLDLTDWDFENQGNVTLNGDWAFYWEKFVDDADNLKPDIYAKVPDVWNNYEIAGKKLPAYGYATYSLRIQGVGDGQLALRIPPCSTAYELYIDGKLLAQNGVVSRTEQGSEPEYEPESITFLPTSDELTITMRVSNYVYARGGAWYPIILGTPSQISGITNFLNQRDLFLVGSFITMSLFCFSMFCLANKKYSIILFAFLAIITALRTTIYGAYLFSSFGVSFRLLVIFEYITLIWMPTLISLFLLSMAEKNNLKKLAAAISAVGGILTIFIMIVPVHVFTRYTIPIELFGLVIALYSLFSLLKSNSKSKTAIVLGATVLIACGIYDVLYQNCFLGGFAELSPIGFFVMLTTWGVTIAKDYTDLTESARVSAEKAQTSEIAFLQAQIKPHFLYNALNVIATLCRLDSEYAEKLTIDLSKYLHYSFEFKNLSKFISFASELDFIETYVKIEKARFVDEFEVFFDLCDTSKLTVPPLSIQPLIENAIRHGVRKKEQYGTVILRVREEQNSYIIEVEDDGAGIEPEKLERLKHGIRQEYEGVGLINVKQRIESLYRTDIVITSEVGVGTKILITIPKNESNSR